ncbi:MAG: hypothetical protein L0I76_14800 [Pseudonocardia sp.]|nr:hypothetical protein [Pseudonocardia sp.]
MPDPASPDTGHEVAPATPPDPTPADLTPPDATPAPDYDEHGTPSLDYVRDKIDARFATSLGSTELAEDTTPARDQADQQAERDRKAADRLEEIRRSMG